MSNARLGSDLEVMAIDSLRTAGGGVENSLQRRALEIFCTRLRRGFE